MFTRFSGVIVISLKPREIFFFFFSLFGNNSWNKLTLSKNCHFLLGEGAEEEILVADPQAQQTCPPGPACSRFTTGEVGLGGISWEEKGWASAVGSRGLTSPDPEDAPGLSASHVLNVVCVFSFLLELKQSAY